MKLNFNKIIFTTLAVLLIGMTGCYDEKMKWGDPYTHPAAEALPLALQEQISRYDAINAYANFKIGAGIDFNLYMNDEAYRNLVNQNFDEITPGNEMKQQSLMNTSGKLNFANADAVIARLQAAGLTIYGHCLVWHSQQQATFLNSLLQPTQIPGSPGESLVDGSFENGMQGWTPAYYVENYSIVTTSAIDGTHSLQVIIPADATGGKYDGHGQLNSPTFPIISGHHYQISFWIKGSAPGKVAIDFPNAKLGNQYPWVNGAEFASVGTTWTQVVYNTSTVGGTAMIATADDAAMKVRLLLAAVPDVTYLIDAIEITDLDAAPAVVNLVQNGNFENGLSGWNIPYYAENYTIETSDVIDGTQALQVIIPADATGGKYDGHGQLNSPEFPIINGHQYQISFWIKGSVTGKVAIDFPNANLGNQYPWVNGAEFAPVGTSWTQVIYNNTTVGGAAMIATADNAAMKVRLLLAAVPDVTYLIDALEVIDLDAAAPSPAPAINRGGPITIDKTPEEKAHIVDSVLVAYIDSVAKHFKGKIAAWDVVNEPMENNGRLRIGTEDLTATSYFYWAYYLGKDYAVKAFKAAHAADPSAKMFINDYALESANSAKLDSLIAYVKYIDDNGGQVDGIGTQLHLSINNLSDTVAIANMFTKLAATGKLIKISELDIAFSNSAPSSPVAPTLEQQGQQAKLYEYVARKYSQIIPVSQQYGITVWGVSDNANEHQYWLKNDAPCLWNADYTRKWSYKGFCDGLAGKDVGAEFPGTLQ